MGEKETEEKWVKTKYALRLGKIKAWLIINEIMWGNFSNLWLGNW